MPSLATWNANNFFLRYRFNNVYPGDLSRGSLIEASEVASIGYLPGRAREEYGSRYIIWDPARRELAATALLEPDNRYPDILCLQEVENIQAIRKFNENYLENYYPYSLLIDAYDPRNIDVGVLSRLPITRIRSHIEDRLLDDARPFENRDCLEVTFELPDGESLTLLVNHLKSKFVRRRQNESNTSYRNRVRRSHQRREAQAQEVERITRRRFHGQLTTALYAVVGDFNDTPESPWLDDLVNSSILTDVVARHRSIDDRWTYYYRSRNRVQQIDYVLASRALRDRIDNVVVADGSRIPYIERGGLAYRELNAQGETLPVNANLVYFDDDGVTPVPANFTAPTTVPFRFPRYTEILDDWRNNVSDHCPVKIWF
jgi:endonuclease/exonuclease/phosphatase family metal-dependent hydrolase